MLLFSSKPSIDTFNVTFISVEDIDQSPLKAELSIYDFKGHFGQTVLFSEKKTLVVGVSLAQQLKINDPFASFDPYKLGAIIAKSIEKTTVNSIAIENITPLINQTVFSIDQIWERLLLGLWQGRWTFDTYLKDKSKELQIVTTDSHVNINRVSILAKAMVLTRELIEEVPEVLHPRSFCERVEQELKDVPGVDVHVMDAAHMKTLGMEGILLVGRASRYEPQMIHAVYKPKGQVKKRICLVGKGITYDSGGMNIKTAHMKTMKMDMGGAGTMFGVFKAIAQLGLQNTEVQWLSAMEENMLAGNAYKPDDIYKSYSGITVEVGNTDAEGRLNLADLLTYATEQEPDYIIDAATLTGAAVFSVSSFYTAMMANDAKLSNSLYEVFKNQLEPTVELHMSEDMREWVKGEKSDLYNISKVNEAGHLTAGLFLSNFVEPSLFTNPKLKNKDRKEGYAWAHLDIAGSAFSEKRNTLEYNGATGQSVRSLVAWLEHIDATIA
jgi:leucyl aminopeptidase